MQNSKNKIIHLKPEGPMKVEKPLNSLYIHIPFCKDKCYYCNFVSFANKNNEMECYINSLMREMRENLAHHRDITLKSIYIGGGTPSLLDINYYRQILDEIKLLVNISGDAEITIEVNPGTITREYLKELRKLGFNRLSIGVQSFNDDILRLINRKHNSNDALTAVKMAKSTGFSNISIDLIYGLPEQNMNIWLDTLNIAAGLDILHISAYGLKIEEGTHFAKDTPLNLPDEELSAQMYLKTIEILAEYGLRHYEISNFAKEGYESRHNLAYWNNEGYFGFGLSAHGYIDGIRYSNTTDLSRYITHPLDRAEAQEVSKQEALEESIFLGLRKIKGINIEDINKEYDINLLKKYESIIDKAVNSDHMKITDGYLSLTTEGILLSNAILADFLE